MEERGISVPAALPDKWDRSQLRLPIARAARRSSGRAVRRFRGEHTHSFPRRIAELRFRPHAALEKKAVIMRSAVAEATDPAKFRYAEQFSTTLTRQFAHANTGRALRLRQSVFQ